MFNKINETFAMKLTDIGCFKIEDIAEGVILYLKKL